MRLSEAMRLGIGAVRHDPTLWFIRNNEPKGCALCTALYAVGYDMKDVMFADRVYTAVAHYWPWATRKGIGDMTVAQTISSRNQAGESREALADWVETIEPVEPAGGKIAAPEMVEAP